MGLGDRKAFPHRPGFASRCVAVGSVATTLLTSGCVIAPDATPQTVTPAEYVSEALDLMSDALFASPDRFEEVQSRLLERTVTATSVEDTYEPIAAALLDLGGPHSRFYTPAEAADSIEDSATGDVPVVSDSGGITTIQLPSITATPTSDFGARYIATAHESLTRTRESTSAGYIIDLRGNTGGNVWPMLASIAPLLTDGVVLQFTGITDTTSVQISGSEVSFDGEVMANGDASFKADLPIAVLLDTRTASSAEAVVVSFIGQPNTRSFGERSYGFSTSNDERMMPDGAILSVTVGADTDRNGTIYGDAIIPDQVFIANAEATTEAARTWLKAEPQIAD